MPEGVEVKWMVEHINKNILKGSDKVRLQGVDIVSGRYKTHGAPKNYQAFNKFLKDNVVRLGKLQNKGKFIYLVLPGTDWSVWITLGMSGELMVDG